MRINDRRLRSGARADHPAHEAHHLLQPGDGFASGYASIGELANLPADILKIDRGFVASEDARRRRLIELMVEAAHAFGLGVVAEGIETPEMYEAMAALGCDLGQGYLMARPVPAAQIAVR